MSGAAALRLLQVPLRALALGASYGVKIRFPHALLMSLLFDKNNALNAILNKVARTTFTHAKNLAYFAFVYKLAVAICRQMPSSLLSSPAVSSTIGGAAGGYLVWRHYTALNYQILLYLLSRVLVGAVRAAAAADVKPFSLVTFKKVFPILSIAVWAAVMYLYECQAASLHPSLVSSMNEIYRAADNLTNGTPSPATIILFLHTLTQAGSWQDIASLLSVAAS
jgi:peroxisomal membrane protein 4